MHDCIEMHGQQNIKFILCLQWLCNTHWIRSTAYVHCSRAPECKLYMIRVTQLRYGAAFRRFFSTKFQVPTLYRVVVVLLFIHRKIHPVLYALLCVLRNQRKNANP